MSQPQPDRPTVDDDVRPTTPLDRPDDRSRDDDRDGGQDHDQDDGQDGGQDDDAPDAGGAGSGRTADRVLVVTPQGMSVTGDASDEQVSGMVEQPAKVMRIGSMIKQLLEEVRSAPLDEAGRARLAQVHAQTIAELETGLSDDLVAELRRIALPFAADTPPSDAELRVAQAQLVGWLEGLFHGIQTTLFAQQMAARAQLEQMRRQALSGPVVAGAGEGAQDRPDRPHQTGQYL
ncbi:bacterial proteasome activator family protein [Aquipuribacter sp. SD81]|uniref:bacterial proteasome activator family protein n=1 Tax=Aquipuribacter sp. SD81 TaxID=3127703 RepID=UPI003017F067